MTIRYYSDLLDKYFDTETELNEAEEIYKKRAAEVEEERRKLEEKEKARVKAIEEKKEKLASERKADADAVKKAFDEVASALKQYEKQHNEALKLRNAFVRKYGAYHTSYFNVSPTFSDLFDLLFKC